MNKNLDGTSLTTDQLLGIAINKGLKTKKELDETRAHMHHEALFHTMLITLTAEERFSMLSRGELKLDTRR